MKYRDYKWNQTKLPCAAGFGVVCVWTDDLPHGWRDSFVQDMCDELDAIIGDAFRLGEYHIQEVKEKNGTLVWKHTYPEELDPQIRTWQDRYEKLSKTVCVSCGKPGEMKYTTWASPWCDDCFADKKLLNYREMWEELKYRVLSERYVAETTLSNFHTQDILSEASKILYATHYAKEHILHIESGHRWKKEGEIKSEPEKNCQTDEY